MALPVHGADWGLLGKARNGHRQSIPSSGLKYDGIGALPLDGDHGSAVAGNALRIIAVCVVRKRVKLAGRIGNEANLGTIVTHIVHQQSASIRGPNRMRVNRARRRRERSDLAARHLEGADLSRKIGNKSDSLSVGRQEISPGTGSGADLRTFSSLPSRFEDRRLYLPGSGLSLTKLTGALDEGCSAV